MSINAFTDQAEPEVSRKAGIIGSLAVSVLSLVVVFLAAEVFLRVAGSKLTQKPFRSDRPRDYFLASHANNMRGNPDEPGSSTKPEFKLAVVGDSFTFGPELQVYDTYPRRLNWLLNLNREHVADVFSYGTPGAATKDEVELVRKALLGSPNLLLLQITLNDAQLNPLKVELPDFKTPEGSGGWLGRSKIITLIRTRLHNKSTVQKYIDYHYNLVTNPETEGLFLKPLDKIKGLAATGKVPLVAVIFPLYDFPIDTNYPFKQLHRRIQGYLAARNIDYLDLTREFEGMNNERLQIRPGLDSHPNEIAHRIAADAIFRWLAKRQLIPNSVITPRVYRHRRGIWEESESHAERLKSKLLPLTGKEAES